MDFLGGIHNPASVRELLGSVDCYVLVTNLDCCPVTVLEASLMRLPVIASRVCGVPETILNKKTGWTVNNDSTQEWVDRINQIIADPSWETGLVKRADLGSPEVCVEAISAPG